MHETLMKVSLSHKSLRVGAYPLLIVESKHSHFDFAHKTGGCRIPKVTGCKIRS